jgi:Na+:H+ antiporter, NhaA family
VINGNWLEMLLSPVSLGVMVGLVGGKLLGIFGLSMLGLKLGWFKMPPNLNTRMILGVSLLAAIGFTMSLFINSLAFENEIYMEQAKMGILSGSLIAGVLGYFIIKSSLTQPKES